MPDDSAGPRSVQPSSRAAWPDDDVLARRRSAARRRSGSPRCPAPRRRRRSSMRELSAAQDGAEPDARAVAYADVADEYRGRREPHLLADRRPHAAELHDRGHQLPRNSGSRRSRAAARPSRWSSDCSSAVWARLSARIALRWSVSAASCSSRFAAAKDSGARVEHASPRARARERAAGRRRRQLRSADRAARAPRASRSSPPSSTSLARARPRALTSRVRPPCVGHQPDPALAEEHRGPTATPTRQSHASASARPAPVDDAVDRGDRPASRGARSTPRGRSAGARRGDSARASCELVEPRRDRRRRRRRRRPRSSTTARTAVVGAPRGLDRAAASASRSSGSMALRRSGRLRASVENALRPRSRRSGDGVHDA